MDVKPTVLVADDEIVNRRILKRILINDFNIIEAEDGEQAWNKIQKKRYIISAVLLDIDLPIINSFEILKRISKANIKDLPVIIVTDCVDDESETNTLNAGAWDYVTKPYNAKVLTSRLKNAIARSQVSTFEKLKRLSEHDGLTGCYTRNRMFSDTHLMLNNYPDVSFAFIRIDIDHFALFNTSFGEAEGDKLLIFFSECVKSIVEEYDYFSYGRMATDIFCACFDYNGNEEALREKINWVQKQLSTYRDDYVLEISCGVFVINDKSLSVDDYYFRASIAAQNCKNRYAAHLSFYDEEVGNKLANEISITNEMQNAIDEEQFVVYLQPKISLTTELACGAEALVRWVHPKRGIISPGEFIPVFEKNGFISKLDYYVWEQTCQLIRKWIDNGKTVYPVSVNISRISMYNPQLVSLITGLVNKYNISTSLLQLEITESAYMTNPELMEATIVSLHNAGFVILMDDFGSGYSSLNTLKRIKVDVLKVDMKFLPVNDETERGEIILACVIKMANWLGMPVVVEGVETRRQRDFLEGVGCDYVQGFFYSKPIPVDEFEEKYILQRVASKSSKSKIKISNNLPKHNMTVLIISDSEIDCAILTENLSDLYNIEICRNAEAGLAYLKSSINKVKLILLDDIMPGMNGIEFLRYCKRDKILMSIPKILITAEKSIDSQSLAFKEGAYDYITKPLIKEVINARVSHVMEISKQVSVFNAVEYEYKHHSERDADTGLLNKIAFYDLETRIISAAPDEREAVLILDIDNLKSVNNNYGHDVGDKVIEIISSKLKSEFRSTDLISRLNGDKFAVMMTKIPSYEIARHKATEFIKVFTFSCVSMLNISVSVSIGITFSKAGDTAESLYTRGDSALHEAKSTGKSMAVVYGEKIPPVSNDNKPVVLICSKNKEMLPALAFGYGDGAAFVYSSTNIELSTAFKKYKKRISTVCLDIMDENLDFVKNSFSYVKTNEDSRIPIIAVCKEGNMEQIREALKLDIFDIISFPSQTDAIQRRLSMSIMNYNNKL